MLELLRVTPMPNVPSRSILVAPIKPNMISGALENDVL